MAARAVRRAGERVAAVEMHFPYKADGSENVITDEAILYCCESH